jgi:hypothetical protein
MVLTVGGVDGTTWYNLLFPSNKRLYLLQLQAQWKLNEDVQTKEKNLLQETESAYVIIYPYWQLQSKCIL